MKIITNLRKILKEEKSLQKVRYQILIQQRERDRRTRFNNLTVDINPPRYEDIINVNINEDGMNENGMNEEQHN